MFPFIIFALEIVSLHRNRRMTKTEVGTREQDIAVTCLAMPLFGRIWTLGLWIRKAADDFKLGLLDHTSRNTGDSCSESNINYDDLAQEY